MKAPRRGPALPLTLALGLGGALGATLAAPPDARAQAAPEVRSSVSARQVEVGEPFEITLEAMSASDASFTNPEFSAPPGFQVQGPSVGRKTVAVLGVGVKTGVTASWTLTAEKKGSFTLPGPSLRVNGERVRTPSLRVDVVAATGSGRRGRRPGRSPFLFPPSQPFSFHFNWPFGSLGSEPDEEDLATDKSLELPAPIAEGAFLRAVADKKEAVVGEQVTVSFYVYSRIDVEMSDRREPPVSDFSRFPLLDKPGAEPPRFARVGGRMYTVRLLDRVAAFPLKTGTLTIGSMRASFTGRRIGTKVERASPELKVRVTEPPLEGRPAGYALGDVGRFSLTSSVAPRKTEQGGSVVVSLKVSGEGNFPQRLRVPARTGVEWLDPEKRDAISAEEGKVAGSRTFNYVVKLGDAGKIDLGTVELPYWDPEAKRYETTKAVLGAVEVKEAPPSAEPPPPPLPEAADPLARLPAPRTSMEPYAAPARGLAPGRWFFWLLLLPPLATLLVSGAARAGRALRDRRQKARSSPAFAAERALADAEAAALSGDARTLSAAVERALHAAIEAASGLKSRGVLAADLPRELEARGLSEELGARARDLLETSAALRFDPGAEGGKPRKAMEALLARARALVADLGGGASGEAPQPETRSEEGAASPPAGRAAEPEPEPGSSFARSSGSLAGSPAPAAFAKGKERSKPRASKEGGDAKDGSTGSGEAEGGGRRR